MGRRIPKPGGDGAMVEPGRCADRCASRPVSYPNLVILPSWLRACILVFRPWSGMAASPYSTTHPHDPHDLPQTAGRPHASEALGPEVRSWLPSKDITGMTTQRDTTRTWTQGSWVVFGHPDITGRQELIDRHPDQEGPGTYLCTSVPPACRKETA